MKLSGNATNCINGITTLFQNSATDNVECLSEDTMQSNEISKLLILLIAPIFVCTIVTILALITYLAYELSTIAIRCLEKCRKNQEQDSNLVVKNVRQVAIVGREAMLETQPLKKIPK